MPEVPESDRVILVTYMAPRYRQSTINKALKGLEYCNMDIVRDVTQASDKAVATPRSSQKPSVRWAINRFREAYLWMQMQQSQR